MSTWDTTIGSGGKKNRQKERRLMKGFNLGVSSLSSHLSLTTSTVLPATAEVRNSKEEQVCDKKKRSLCGGSVIKTHDKINIRCHLYRNMT